MVRIVKLDPHPTVVREVVCKNCGATLEYVPNDIKETRYKDIDGGWDVDRNIDCPNCNKPVNVKGMYENR